MPGTELGSTLGAELGANIAFKNSRSKALTDEMSDRKAKSFNIINNKGILYLYRNKDTHRKMKVSVDNKILGFTFSETFMEIILEPGLHSIQGDTNFKIDLNVSPGKLYFISQEQSQYWYKQDTPSDIKIENEITGKESVLKCELLIHDQLP